MAASNDNQGLKIAVAALVMLVFILGVTNYFAFSSSSREAARAEAASKAAGESDTKAREAAEQYNFARTYLGYGNVDDHEAFKTALAKDAAKISTEIQAYGQESQAAVAEAQKAGAQDAKLDTLLTTAKEVVQAFVSEPNENKLSIKSLERMKEIVLNESRLLRELSLDYVKLRSELGSANSVNSVESNKSLAAKDLAVKEKQDQLSRYAADVQALNDTITNLQNSEKDKTNSLTDLTNKLTDETNKFVTFRSQSQKAIQDLKDRLALRYESFSGKALGRITYTDFGRGEVRVSANAKDGLRPMMRLTVFDRDAQGIPTDKPKGAISIISVGNPERGQRDSVARIIETKDPLDPIRYNDQIYTPTQVAGKAEQFALIGPMDMNRDGRDDRADLVRLIEQSGGEVVYDLPPIGADRTPGRLAVERAFSRTGEAVPPVTGRGSGRISPETRAYILDLDADKPLSGDLPRDRDNLTPDAVAFAKEKSDAIKEARANGVTPLPLSRFLSSLGYTPRTSGVDSGNVETKNRNTIRNIIKPAPVRPGAISPAAPGGATPPPADEPK